jgi:hypothetical protein
MAKGNEGEPLDVNELPMANFQQALAALSNTELLRALDLSTRA